MRFLYYFLGAIVVTLPLVGPASADQVPLWEVGAGVAAIDFPHYRGSDERKSYVLPMPYVIYRGDFLKIDRQRVRGQLFHSDRVELDVSVNGSVPVRNNGARLGMPNLDPTFEIGPSMNIMLYQTESNQAQVELRLPVRAVIGSDFSYLRSVGWIFQPLLNLDVKNAFDQTGWNLGTAIGPIFTDRRYNQYFYGIDARYSLADRPAYSAHGGYAGTQFVIAMTKRSPSYWTSGFMKLDNLRGAAFEQSPLVKTKQYATVGFAITWIFAESSTKVEEEK
ncbi:MAG: MipA/OmpV family protein [Nitrosomonadales bacterium]|nr:MipA/OmpV family protein [Nitrosomonadales bacterium]